MANQSKTTEQIYKSLQPMAMNEYAPRVGYYQITTTYEKVVDGFKLKMARAKWKLNEQDDYLLEVEVQLMSFYRNPFKGSDAILNGNLIGVEIEVKASSRLNGLKGRFVVDWFAVMPKPKGLTEEEKEVQEFQLMDDIEKLGQADEVDLAIEIQLAQDNEVLNAGLLWEDMVYDDAVYTNDWIFALQAQNIEEQK